MKFNDAVDTVRSLNISDDEDELTFKSAVIIWLGLNNGWDEIKLIDVCEYGCEEVNLVIANLKSNEILVDGIFYADFDFEDSLDFIVEYTLLSLAGAGILIRTFDKKEEIKPKIIDKMSTKKTLNEHLFDTLDRLSNASGEDIQLEVDKAASIISVSQEILNVAQMKLNIIAAGSSINKFKEIIDDDTPKEVQYNKGVKLKIMPPALINTEDENEIVEHDDNEDIDEDEELVDYGGRMVNKKTLDKNINKDKTHSSANSKYL